MNSKYLFISRLSEIIQHKINSMWIFDKINCLLKRMIDANGISIIVDMVTGRQTETRHTGEFQIFDFPPRNIAINIKQSRRTYMHIIYSFIWEFKLNLHNSNICRKWIAIQICAGKRQYYTHAPSLFSNYYLYIFLFFVYVWVSRM